MGGRGSSSTTGKATTYKLYYGSTDTNIENLDVAAYGLVVDTGQPLLFFSESRSEADELSHERLPGPHPMVYQMGKKGRVYEVDVTMRRPLDFRSLSAKDKENLMKLDPEGDLDEAMIDRLASRNHSLLKSYVRLYPETLKQLGYDGVILYSDNKAKTLEYAVVSNDQVRIRR